MLQNSRQPREVLKTKTKTKTIPSHKHSPPLAPPATKINRTVKSYASSPPEELDKSQHNSKFKLPWPSGRDSQYLKDKLWYRSLLDISSKFDKKEPVFVVCSDNLFKEALLNWLISALILQKEAPKNILVVTSNTKICSLLETHKLEGRVHCLFIPIKQFVNAVRDLPPVHEYKFLFVIRLSVLRILNHLGFDVMNMDLDAILLRNPIPVLKWYRDSDVVGTYGGRLPPGLHQRWGIVPCMGAILIRSTPNTGTY